MKVSVDALARDWRILDYGIVKTEPRRDTNLVWYYFRKFWPKKLTVKRGSNDALWFPDHDLCMLCYESIDQEHRGHVTVKLVKWKSPTTMSDLDVKTGLLTGLLAGKQGWKWPVALLMTCCGSKSLKVILIEASLDLDFRSYPVLNPLVTL